MTRVCQSSVGPFIDPDNPDTSAAAPTLYHNVCAFCTRCQPSCRASKLIRTLYSSGQAEDVIDWDDDDTKIASAATKKEEPKPAPPPAADTETDTPAAPSSAPAKTKSAKPASTPAAEAVSTETEKQDEVPKAAAEDAGAAAPAADEKPAEPAPSFAIGLEASNADEELKKREARAKRFGITTDSNSEEAKKAERAKKFGTDTAAVVKGLDAPLPERRPKRGRDQGEQAEGGGKRQDRRNGGNNKSRGGRRSGGRPNRNEGGGLNILTDPSEKAKADARAKRFGGGN